MDVPFLGNHIEITLALFLPLYALFPHPITLLVLQSLMLGLGAVPLFLICRRELNNLWGIIFVLSYLLYPPVGFTNLNEFHPESFLPFIQFFMFYFFLKDDFKKFIIFMLLCLFSKENMSLIIIMFGLYALLQRKKGQWVVIPMLSGLIWFWLYLKVIFPNLSHGNIEYFGLYNHLGRSMSEIVQTIITHPIATLRFMATPHKLFYLNCLLGPLGFFSLLSPILLIALPNFLQHFLSLRLETVLFVYYPAESLAFIFISAVFGLRFILKVCSAKERINVFYALIPLVAIFYGIVLGPQLYLIKNIKIGCEKTSQTAIKAYFLGLIPKNASVVSTFEYLPRLSNTTNRLYSFHRVITGYYHTKMNLILPADVEFALVDFSDVLTFWNFFRTQENKSNLISFFKNNRWGVVEFENNVVLFKKNNPTPLSLYEIVDSLPKINALHLNFDDNIELLGYRMKSNVLLGMKRFQIEFFWKSLKETAKDYWLFIELLSADGSMVYSSNIHPVCYRLYPTYMWKKNLMLKEEYRISLPVFLKKGKYKLYICVFDYLSGKVSRPQSLIAKDIENSWVKLADIQIE